MEPTIRFSMSADRDGILDFIRRMEFNPRDAATWDSLNMLAITAWQEGRLIGAIPLEPRRLRVGPDQVAPALHETVVAVDPDHRNRGIGTRMQDAIADHPPAQARLATVFREQPDSPAYRWYVKNQFFPAMQIESWLCDEPSAIASGDGTRLWEASDAELPWDELESRRLAHPDAAAGGRVDPASRPLRQWLAVHPYRKQYSFHVVSVPGGGMAILGVGALHSQTIRADVLELLSEPAKPDSAKRVLTACAAMCVRQDWHPLRVALARHDPRTRIAQSLNFHAGWAFDMLVRPLSPELLVKPDMTWRYAAIDYI